MTLTRLISLVQLGRAPHARLPRFLDYLALASSRRALGRLDEHLLRDIGLTRAEAEAEARRPAWDAPPHWKG